MIETQIAARRVNGCGTVLRWAHNPEPDVRMVRMVSYGADKSKMNESSTLVFLPAVSSEQYKRFLIKQLPHVNLNLDSANETWLVLDRNEEIVGHYSLWFGNNQEVSPHTPLLEGRATGYIGHYFARDFAIGNQLLKHACQRLKQCGCNIAIGPIDGNTWRRYRLVIEGGDNPSFFMEPSNPAEYPVHFTGAGFKVLATYSSSVVNVAAQFDKSDRVILPDVSIRSIDVRNFENELRDMYGIACDAFQNNFLYSRIEENEFLQRYLPLKSLLVPEFVLIAERNGKPVGFVLALPDRTERGMAEKILIIKTLARKKDNTLKGLGLRLMSECHARAHELGYKKIIHALYKNDNISSTYSTTSDSRVFRKYAIYSFNLEQAS